MRGSGLKILFQSGGGQEARKKDAHFADRVFFWITQSAALLMIALFCSMAILIFIKAFPAFQHFGWNFFVNPAWDGPKENFGALSFIYGTIVSSVLALILAAPASVAMALFLNELSHPWISRPLSFIIEMLAAIPSIVYGIWGVFVLAPFLREHVQPFLFKHFGGLPLFSGSFYGVGLLCAGLILAVMIIPTISSISKEVFASIPFSSKESVLSLGATRWEMLKIAVLRGGAGGIAGAVVLGFGRAFGETMAVTMVIGNKPSISASLFDPAQTMASLLATQYAEADTELHLSSLTAVGFTLFAVSLCFNFLSVLLVQRIRKKFEE